MIYSRMRTGSIHVARSTVAVVLLAFATTAEGQIAEGPAATAVRRAPAKAAVLSLVLPGLGHRYADGGRWSTTASLFAVADIALWLGMIETVSARARRIDSYRALAVASAGASVDDKDRRFFLNLATYRSSDEYLEVQLRNRAWDQLDYVSDPAYQWKWEEDKDFQAFRRLREDAESLGRRRSILIATLVADRVVAAVLAMRAAGRSNRSRVTQLVLAPPQAGSVWPELRMRVAF